MHSNPVSITSPRTPSGTLDLLPAEQACWRHMLDTIRACFARAGFAPLETAALELTDVLLTKSGGETEKQVYFVQSTGSLAQGHAPDMALRYDLTVPLARYVATHERTLSFPFKRWQMQPVWRGERPQRGRFREFVQCDVDIVGRETLSPLHDAEVAAVLVDALTALNIPPFTVQTSNRKILLGWLMAQGITDPDRHATIVRTIDKLDKIGTHGVRETLTTVSDTGCSLSSETADRLLQIITTQAPTKELLTLLGGEGALLQEGVGHVRAFFAALHDLGVPEDRVRLNLSIARGLDYYTGTVYETMLDDHPHIGSIASGGRYENLASLYTKTNLPGVGISIGLTRLFDQLRALNCLPSAPATVDVLVTWDSTSRPVHDSLRVVRMLRAAGLRVEAWLEPARLDKQLRHANKRGIPFVILWEVGSEPHAPLVVKNMIAHTQETVPIDQLVDYVRTLAVF